MPSPEVRLAELNLTLPAPIKLPPGMQLPFTFINVRADRAFVSGHPKQATDGSLAGPYGQSAPT